MKKIILFILLVIFLSFNTCAIGVTPAKKVYDFEPGLSDTIEFTIVNSEDRFLYVEMEVIGDLKDYFDLKKTAITLDPKERKTFETTFTLPLNIDLAPGEHRTLILASETIPEVDGETPLVGAVAAIGLPVLVNVPYDGKYLDAVIEVKQAEVNKDVRFIIHLES